MAGAPLDGRVALVTGASRGIGAATAIALDAAGARVALAARSRADLERVAAGLGNDPVLVPCDLADPDAPAALAREATERLGGSVDVLVNNAAVGALLALADVDRALIDHLYAVNVRATLLLVQALVPGMIDRGRGSIVSVSSVSGVLGTPHRSIYAATKGAIDAMTRSLASELGAHGIRVNSVVPGVVDTDMWAPRKAIPGVVDEVGALTPLRRFGQPAEIADAIVFLASDAARFVTGESLHVDGGMGRTAPLPSGVTSEPPR